MMALAANRETAIVQALVTSGVMYVVARNCSTGALLSCTCDPHIETNRTGMNRTNRSRRMPCKDKEKYKLIIQDRKRGKINVTVNG